MAQPAVGPVVHAGHVKTAVLETVKLWLPFYLAEVDDQDGLTRGTTAPPRGPGSYSAHSTPKRFAEQTPPAVVVVCPGTASRPDRHGGDTGSYGAWWEVHILATVGGATDEGSQALGERYSGALTALVSQQGTMGGLAAETEWVGARVDLIGENRKLVACEVVANVRVHRVVDTRGVLPTVPPADPTDLPDPTHTPSGVRVRITRTP